ncbi:MAG: outer membrane beta-barrel protein, partial [Bacteroidota bacterium]
FSVQPMLIARYGQRRGGSNIRLIYRANAQAPSATQLQEVLDNSNPILLSIGNAGLEQSIAHNVFIRWNKLSKDRTKVFYGLLGGTFTNNYIGSATYLQETDAPIFDRVELTRGSQLTQPVNLDGQYNLRALVTYGLPVQALKSNLNLSVESNLARTPSLLDDLNNEATSHTYGAGVTISSNISEKVDFTISSNLSVNNTNNSLRSDFDSRYYNQRSKLKLNLIFGPDLVFNTQLSHQYFDAFNDDFNQNFWLWNISLGKQIFTNRRGKIALSVFDALKQNNALQQNVTGTYVENLQSLVLQRYFMLSFTYQLRHFGKAPEKDPEQDRFERMRRFMGF